MNTKDRLVSLQAFSDVLYVIHLEVIVGKVYMDKDPILSEELVPFLCSYSVFLILIIASFLFMVFCLSIPVMSGCIIHCGLSISSLLLFNQRA